MNLDRSRDLKARTDWSDCTGKSINKTSVYIYNPLYKDIVVNINNIDNSLTALQNPADDTTGLDISARPLAQASVKSVGRVQITHHSPVWRVRFFIAKKLIKLHNKRCFLYSVLPTNL